MKRKEVNMALPARVSRHVHADPFEMIHREFDNVLSRVFGGNDAGGVWAPFCVDVREDADHIYVEADMPGFKKDDIEITLENQTLTISAERRESNEQQKKGDYLLNERRYTRFLRSFTLPPTVDDRKVDAKLADGVLTIVLDKREESKPRKIQIT